MSHGDNQVTAPQAAQAQMQTHTQATPGAGEAQSTAGESRRFSGRGPIPPVATGDAPPPKRSASEQAYDRTSDDSKAGKALQLILATSQQLGKLGAVASRLMQRAQDHQVSDARVLSQIGQLTRPAATLKGQLDHAWLLLHDHIVDLVDAHYIPVEQAKASTFRHPGMSHALHDLTYRLAHYLSATSGISDARPMAKELLADGPRMLGDLNLIRGNLGLPEMSYAEVIGLVEARVSVSIVDLGSGEPRDQMQESVTEMAAGWNSMVANIETAVVSFMEAIDHAAFQQCPPGLMDRLWSRALALLANMAGAISGTPLAGDIGLEAIKRMVAGGELLEQKRLTADEEAFKRALRDQVHALQLQGVADGGNLQVHQLVSELDAEFIALGKEHPEDAWKKSDNAVVGAQAAFLKDLAKRSHDYVASVPTERDFEAQFFMEFVNANQKERNRSAWRSPVAGSTYMDGYIELDLTLYAGATGLFLSMPGTATLHCPKAKAVASRLVEAMGGVSLPQINTSVFINVTTDDLAMSELPAAWRGARTRQVRLDSDHLVTSTTTIAFWEWALTACHTSTYDVLAAVRKLEGV